MLTIARKCSFKYCKLSQIEANMNGLNKCLILLIALIIDFFKTELRFEQYFNLLPFDLALHCVI